MTPEAGNGAGGLTCRELVSLVTEYLEDALGPAERAGFDHHLSACPGCVDHLDQMRLTIEATGRLREEDVPPEAMDQLLDAFRTWRRAN